jgi:transposase
MRASTAAISREDLMDVVHPRCCGLDVHKQTVVACVLISTPSGEPQKTLRTFGTVTEDLLALGDWLAEQGATHVAMEATASYWKPVVRHEALFDREGMKGPLLRTVAAVR